MNIYLVRHAEAVNDTLAGVDYARFLDADGRQTARRVGTVLRENQVAFDAVVASPYVRAIQTAELVCERVDYLGTIITHPALTPDSMPTPIIDYLKSLDVDHVAVFGHEPNISHLASLIVGQEGFAPFRRGQVCAFNNSEPLWKIRPDAGQMQDLFV